MARSLVLISLVYYNMVFFSYTQNKTGTGKTTTIVELIRRAVLQHGMKVLVAAPSNVAVDNVLCRLVAKNNSSMIASSRNIAATSTEARGEDDDNDDGDDHNTTNTLQEEATKNKPKQRNSREPKINKNKKLRLVRLGHPARLQANILPYSLEALVQSADGTEVVADARQELQSLLRILSSSSSNNNNNKKTKSGGGGGGEIYFAKKAAAYREIKLLRKEIRQREEQVVQELLRQADVVLATCVGAANRLLGNANDTKKSDNKNNVSFDLVVIDEAAQALVKALQKTEFNFD
jgi:superfamily I DNA and/or RNA helicase